MASPGKTIRVALKMLEREAGVVLELREWAKTDGGRLNDFGNALVEVARDNEVTQAFVAKLLDVDPAAISRRYNA